MREKMVTITVRLPQKYLEKIKLLRERGFAPSLILRMAAEKAINAKLKFAEKNGAFNEQNLTR